MTEEKKLNIYQRINEVRKKLEYIKKDANVSGGGNISYMGVSHDAVTAFVREHLVSQGIMIVVNQTEGESINRTRKSGAEYIRLEAWYQICYVNIDDPADRITTMIQSHADDSGDKAPGKCISYAVKMSILKMFNLETGVNDESRLEVDRQYNQMIVRTKEQVDDFIDHNDSLAVFLLGREVGPDIWTDVFNSAPSGRKSEFKKTVNAMEKEGHEVFKAVNQAILQGDDLKAKENLDDITDETKRLLSRTLGTDKTAVLKSMMSK